MKNTKIRLFFMLALVLLLFSGGTAHAASMPVHEWSSGDIHNQIIISSTTLANGNIIIIATQSIRMMWDHPQAWFTEIGPSGIVRSGHMGNIATSSMSLARGLVVGLPNGDFWFRDHAGTWGGQVYRFNSAGTRLGTFPLPADHNGQSHIRSMTVMPNGNVMLISDTGLWQTHNSAGALVSSGSLPFGGISDAAMPLANGGMLIPTVGGLRLVNASLQLISTRTEFSGVPGWAATDPNGNIVFSFGSEETHVFFDAQGNFIRIFPGSDPPSGWVRWGTVLRNGGVATTRFRLFCHGWGTHIAISLRVHSVNNGAVIATAPERIFHPSNIVSNVLLASFPDGRILWARSVIIDNWVRPVQLEIWRLYNAPASLVTSAVTQTSLTLSWSANGNLPETRYFPQFRLQGETAWTTASPTMATSANITGLLPGRIYEFRIRAEDFGELYVSGIHTRLMLPPTPAPTVAESGGLAWHPNEGRGFARLTWPAVTGATGYVVLVLDGQDWRRFDIGNRLHWDSREELIYPTEAQIAGFAPGTRTADIFNRVRLGLNLRDNPNALYRTAQGTWHHNCTFHGFLVTAYNASGESPIDWHQVRTVHLPNRTDGAPPQVLSATVNNGDATTFSRNVTLQFNASDALSGVATVQVSNDGFLTHQAFPFTGPATVSWQLTPGEGTKTVSVRAVDHAGNLSPVVAATIALVADRLAPQVHLTVNNGASTTESQTATLFINAYDNVTPVSQLQMRVSNDGTNWMHLNNNVWTAGSGWGPYAARPPVWTLTPGGGEKTIFVQVRDSDGNIGIASRFIVLVDGTNRPTANVTLAATATAGSAPNLNGHIVNIGGHLMQVVQGNTASLQLDNLQGATHILISHDGALWSAPEALPAGATSVARLLTFPGEGTRAVHIRLRNEFGVESLPVVFRFLVDHTPPSVTVATQNNATATRSASIGLRVTGTDNLSQRLFFSIGAAPFAELPATGLISAPVVMGLNEINIRIIDEAGNIAPAVARVWRL
jgi:hypothetical protein